MDNQIRIKSINWKVQTHQGKTRIRKTRHRMVRVGRVLDRMTGVSQGRQMEAR